jgi:hypothetical protein
MTTLRYQSKRLVDDLAVGECTMHRASNAAGARWWLLWFRVNRETDGQPDDFAVPMNPNGSFIEDGPGGKTWGLTQTTPGVWQVAPSINVINTGEVHPGDHPAPSLWHQTPTIVDVPDGESWISGAP